MANVISAFSTRGLADFSARRPKTVFALWALAIAAGLALAATVLPNVLTTAQDFTNNPESRQGLELLRDAGLVGPREFYETIVVQSEQYTVDDPAFAAVAGGILQELAGLMPDTIAGAVGYHLTGNPAFVSADRHATIIAVQLAGPESGEAVAQAERVHEVVERARAAAEGFQVLQTGDATLESAFQEVAERDLIKGESIGIAVALVILLLVFGTVVSALVPIVMALVSVAVAVGLSAIVGLALFDLSFFVTNMITMMGLAVGIDYSLFIVSRYREELARGRDKLTAIRAAGGSASRAVFFSGITVVLAISGLLMLPTTIFRSLATGAILVVIVSVLAALTLLPALLSVLGHRIDLLRVRPQARRTPDEDGGFWDRIAHAVMARPVISLVAAAAVLIAAAVPFFSIKTGQAGISTLPDGLEAKEAFLIIEEKFAGQAGGAVRVVIAAQAGSDDVQAAVERLEAMLAQDSEFSPPFSFRADEAGQVGEFTAQLRGDPVGLEAMDAIRRLRSDYLPQAFADTGVRVLVTGDTAATVDFLDLVDRYTPMVFAFVLCLSFLLLMVVFRSIAIPLKSIALNLLSVGAAYGLIVLVTQQGFLIDLFGFQRAETVESWIPLFLFTVLFGLSMDYHVFLLSRVRERYDETGNNTGSVAFGLRSTAGLITGAALIMVAVFGGFASGDLLIFQQMGFGLAVAVLLDATIIRSVLVPAAMKLMGRVNWYFPSFLSWVPRIGIEGERQSLQTPTAAGGAE